MYLTHFNCTPETAGAILNRILSVNKNALPSLSAGDVNIKTVLSITEKTFSVQGTGVSL
jgi:hypothetical protein